MDGMMDHGEHVPGEAAERRWQAEVSAKGKDCFESVVMAQDASVPQKTLGRH